MLRLMAVFLLLVTIAVYPSVHAMGNVLVTVTADAETDVVDHVGDAADDPAIWLHPTTPHKSKIIGTDKLGRLNVYDLDGKKVESYKFGRMNNVDVRYGFPIGKSKIDIVGATNRSNNSLEIFSVGKNGELSKILSHKSELVEVYGFSLYHSKQTGKYYAFVIGKSGDCEQYEIFCNETGKVEGKKVRQFQLGSQGEGMVADDEYGNLFVGEENVGIWKYSAEPNRGNERYKVDDLQGGHLTADIEGLTIYYGVDGSGYLLASSQGDNTYAIYERKDEHKYIGSFEIAAGMIDGTSGTDGIDVLAFNLGPKYPYGIFIAQDEINTSWFGLVIRQNFKIVSWEKIAKAYSPWLLRDSINPRELIDRTS